MAQRRRPMATRPLLANSPVFPSATVTMCRAALLRHASGDDPAACGSVQLPAIDHCYR